MPNKTHELSVSIHEKNNERTHRFDTRPMPPTSPRLSNALLLAIDTKFTRSRILTSLIILPTIFASQLHKLRTSSYVNAFLGTGHTTRTGTLIVTLRYEGLRSDVDEIYGVQSSLFCCLSGNSYMQV